MAEFPSLVTEGKGSSRGAGRWESIWTCCKCERNGVPEVSIALWNSTCRNGHQRCDSCVVKQVKILETENVTRYEDSKIADSADADDEYLLRRCSTMIRNRPRAVSCDSILGDRQRRQAQPSFSPLVAWDDSVLNSKHRITLSIEEDVLQKGQNIGIAIRRTANVNIFDDSASDISLFSKPSSPAENDSEDDLVEKRFLRPVEYFQELDDLSSKVFERSMFPLYIDGEVYKPFKGAVRFESHFFENPSFQNFKFAEILKFCTEVTNLANEDAAYPRPGLHYVDHQMYHRQIAQLNHLIECRNIISGVWENIKEMKTAYYCGDFISLLVLDRTRRGVARLVQIECSSIEKLVIAFEICLLRVMSSDPAMVLLNIVDTVANDVTSACREVLIKLDMSIPDLNSLDIWRCAVHILDMAALSYAGAHTQFFVSETITSVVLPGRSLEKQYFRFCRRTFSCLSEFLRGQQAWVLELYHASTLHVDQPPLSLSTDAVTFGDIWGPMWKSCVLGHEDQIMQYSVGNGVIVPWNRPTSTSRETIEIRKGEVFCHWMPDKVGRDQKDLTKSSILHENDIILVGAPVRLDANDTCRASTADHRQRLRNTGSLTEPFTIQPGRILDSETFQVQVRLPYLTPGYQRQYKMKGRSMKATLIERWKMSPLSRPVRNLEFKLGLEVSTCTYNARRIRLIELFGTQTMLNHLRNISLQWINTECEESFYSALQSADHTAFRELYNSRPDWRTDLGNAIECCFDVLAETGKSGKDLVLFWAPDAEPGEKVTLKSNELSWIGFLEDNDISGTLAVLENRCLELPDLNIGSKCRSNHFDPRQIGSSDSIGTIHGSILETSVHLNRACVPTSIREGRVKSKRYDGMPPEHPYRWSLVSLEEGDKFEFGKKGSLKTITQLTQSQILVKWNSSSDIMRQLQTISSNMPVIGRTASQSPLNIHYECIRDKKENTKPVSFIILDTTKTVLCSAGVSRRSSFHATSPLLDNQPRSYRFETSDFGLPRTMVRTPQSVFSRDVTNELKEIINRWKIRNQSSLE